MLARRASATAADARVSSQSARRTRRRVATWPAVRRAAGQHQQQPGDDDELSEHGAAARPPDALLGQDPAGPADQTPVDDVAQQPRGQHA